MLVEFSVENFLSFRDEQRFSMVAASDVSRTTEVLETMALSSESLLKAAAIYGPNASGKSNLVKALSFVQSLVVDSPERGLNQGTGVRPFRLSTSTVTAASNFEITFVQDGVRYEYYLSVTNTRIEQEKLTIYQDDKEHQWFERISLPGSEQIELTTGSGLQGADSLQPLVRPTVPFLSVAARYNHRQLTNYSLHNRWTG